MSSLRCFEGRLHAAFYNSQRDNSGFITPVERKSLVGQVAASSERLAAVEEALLAIDRLATTLRQDADGRVRRGSAGGWLHPGSDSAPSLVRLRLDIANLLPFE